MLFTESDHETGLMGWKKLCGDRTKGGICLIAGPTQILFEHHIYQWLFALLIVSEQYLTAGGHLVETGSRSKSAAGHELCRWCEWWRIRHVLDRHAQPLR